MKNWKLESRVYSRHYAEYRHWDDPSSDTYNGIGGDYLWWDTFVSDTGDYLIITPVADWAWTPTDTTGEYVRIYWPDVCFIVEYQGYTWNYHEGEEEIANSIQGVTGFDIRECF